MNNNGYYEPPVTNGHFLDWCEATAREPDEDAWMVYEDAMQDAYEDAQIAQREYERENPDDWDMPEYYDDY